MLLMIMRLFARMDSRPSRSIAFASFTGEEAGLLGSMYFVRYPPDVIPINSIVVNINFDIGNVFGITKGKNVPPSQHGEKTKA